MNFGAFQFLVSGRYDIKGSVRIGEPINRITIDTQEKADKLIEFHKKMESDD